MSDESDNDVASGAPHAEAAPVEIEVEVIPDRASPLPDDVDEPVRSRPPPKPKSRPNLPSMGSDRPRRSSIPMPRSSNSPPDARPARVSDSPASDKVVPTSIKPMRVIALGQGQKRSEPPPSAVERTSFRPAAPEGGPLPVDTRAPATGLRAPNLGAARGTSDPAPAPEPDDYDEITPAVRKSPPPRAEEGSIPDIQITTEEDEQASVDRVSVEEVPDAEVAPASDEDPIPVAETEPVASGMIEDLPQETDAEEEPDVDADKSRKPPPPPKRARGSAPPAPSERAVAQALEAPKFEPKPRTRTWWEELFSDDFGRGILPLTDGQIAREVDFIEESLGVAKGGIVMDLACGAGHHAVELAGRGYGVVGFDLSLAQLAIAGEYAQERGQKLNFLQGDMREMSFDQVFDGIYSWNTSFGYFEEEKNVAVAERVFAALRPGGSFLLDVVNRDFVVAQQPSQVWFEGDACVCMDDMSVDFITSRLRVKRTMMLDDGRTRETTFSIRVYSLHELGKLLHDIGFRVTEASGHPAYPGVFFGAQSPRVVILAQKP
jgi:SAM-dependent methyltransferase